MAKLKKTARKTTAAKNPDLQAQAERLSKNLGESAQQVWLAGVGAFGRAQAEGNKLFETLVKEGLSLEQVTRKVAGGRVYAVRDALESKVGQARERASDTWDRLEKVFEERVQRALDERNPVCLRRRARERHQRRRAARRLRSDGIRVDDQDPVAGNDPARDDCAASGAV